MRIVASVVKSHILLTQLTSINKILLWFYNHGNDTMDITGTYQVYQEPTQKKKVSLICIPPRITVFFLMSRKRANIFPVFTRLDPHLIKLAHYVAFWLVEENQLFNSQTWTAGAGGAQWGAHLIPRTLISYKASSNFPSLLFLPLLFFQLPHMQDT